MCDTMTTVPEHPLRRALLGLGLLLAGASVGGCGGGSNPLDNPATVSNPQNSTGQKLSFVYYQRCINPIFLALLQINQNGTISTNTCAGSGCHDNTSGTGGAFRVIPTAQEVDLTNLANTPDVIRTTDMYKNFYSAQGEVVLSSPFESRLLTKPLVLNVLHGGGQIFEFSQDPNVQLIEYWITHPMPSGQDEFSTAANAMFSSNDPVNGTCNTN
jgi:hypothetical protein